MRFHSRCKATSILIEESLGWKEVDLVKNADVVFFPGGADVNPSLYKEKNVASSFSENCDKVDLFYWDRSTHKIKIGICRGAQFLNVMNGGSLWQDVNNHALASGHEAIDVSSGKKILVTSTHHQMMRPTKDAKILMVAYQATFKLCDKYHQTSVAPDKNDPDIEAVYYPKTKSLCCQFHPEMFSAKRECKEWFINTIKQITKK